MQPILRWRSKARFTTCSINTSRGWAPQKRQNEYVFRPCFLHSWSVNFSKLLQLNSIFASRAVLVIFCYKNQAYVLRSIVGTIHGFHRCCPGKILRPLNKSSSRQPRRKTQRKGSQRLPRVRNPCLRVLLDMPFLIDSFSFYSVFYMHLQCSYCRRFLKRFLKPLSLKSPVVPTLNQ